MRRLLCYFLLLLNLLPLSAKYYRSNQLAQMLEETDRILDHGYTYVVDESSSSLYLDGSKLWEESKASNGDDLVIVRRFSDSSDALQRTYRGGRLVHESSSGYTTSYSYMDGKLVLSTTETDEGKISVTSFLRSSDNGIVVGVSQDGQMRLSSDMYLAENELVLENLAPGLIVNGDHTVLDDGTILVRGEFSSSVYSKDGKLLKIESPSSLVVYSYSALGSLETIETTEGTTRTVEAYRDSKAYEQFVYENGSLVSQTVYRQEGNIKTLYSDGRIVAVIYYMKDNRTIDRIEYN